MSAHVRHDLDDLSEFLDGRLTGARRAEVEDRLKHCAPCRTAHDSMRLAKEQVRRLRMTEAPPDLEASLRRALRGAESPGLSLVSFRRMPRRRAFGLLTAAAVVAAATFVMTRPGPPLAARLPEAVAADLRAREAGLLELAIETGDVKRLEAFLEQRNLGFPSRVLDLQMMGFELRGGRADVLSGHPSALMVYREARTGREILCRMLRGRLTILPVPSDERQHEGIPFQVYRVEEVTVVFWPEGEILCALVGRGDPEALVRLAFGKAMKAARVT